MQDKEVYMSVLKKLSGEQTSEEKADFLKWRNESDSNNDFYNQVKALWNQPDNNNTSFFGKFTKKKIKGFIMNQAIGNFIGFVIGLSVVRYFTHIEVERRNIKNLFGLAGRKKEVVNDVPEWLQWALPVIIGYITLEFVNHLIETKKHKVIYKFFTKKSK